MTKNDQELRDFLRDEINLNQTRLDRLLTAVGAVDTYLKDHLRGYQKTEPQGSYALGTLIKPVDDNDEYDADIQVVMNPIPSWRPKDYLDAVYRTLRSNETYADKLRLKTRCVTVDYAGDFHLDVVPRVTSGGKHYVCNRATDRFEVTDGTGYRDWFNEKNRITGGNLKRVVRLLKYLRDHKNNYTVKSILLTTLAGSRILCCRRRRSTGTGTRPSTPTSGARSTPTRKPHGEQPKHRPVKPYRPGENCLARASEEAPTAAAETDIREVARTARPVGRRPVRAAVQPELYRWLSGRERHTGSDRP